MAQEIIVVDNNNPQVAAAKPVTIIENHHSSFDSSSQNEVSFAKTNTSDLPGDLGSEPDLETNTSNSEEVGGDTRADRRAAFKRAADIEKRAQAMEKQAKEKLAKAQSFEALLAKSDDPVELIKALGKDPTEFLRKYQNSMFNIPEEAEPVPEVPMEEQLKARLDKFEAEKEAEKLAQVQAQQSYQVNSYIANKVMPAVADVEKYPLLNSDGDPAQAAQFVYGIMNQYYQQHGEELDPEMVAQHIEDGLYAQAEEKLNSIRKIRKFSKYFKDEIGETPVAQMAPNRKLVPRTLSDSMSSVPAPVTPLRPTKETREQKLARLERKFSNKI